MQNVSETYLTTVTSYPSLAIAGKEQQWQLAKDKLAQGLDPFAIDDDGYCYVYYVIRYGNIEQYNVLVQQFRLDANWEWKGRSALAIALYFGQLNLATLIEARSGVFKDTSVTNPKQTYHQLRQPDIEWMQSALIPSLQQLKTARRELKTLLSWVGAYGTRTQCEMVLAHLTRNAIHYETGEDGGALGIQHPLLGAVIAGNLENIKAIVAHSPNSLQKTLRLQTVSESCGSWRGYKIQHVAAEYGQIHLFPYLRDQGLDLNERMENFYNLWSWSGPKTAYQLMLASNNVEGFRQHLNLVPFESWDGEVINDALGKARMGYPGCFLALKALPIETLKKHKGYQWMINYALSDVCRDGNLEQLKWLISLGAKLPALSFSQYQKMDFFNQSQSPMLAAIRWQQIEVVKMLIQQFQFSEEEQLVATHQAIECRQIEILLLFEKAGFKRATTFTEPELQDIFQGEVGDITRVAAWKNLQCSLLLEMKTMPQTEVSCKKFDEKLRKLKGNGNYITSLSELHFEWEGRKQPLGFWAFEWKLDAVFKSINTAYLCVYDTDPEHRTLFHKLAILSEAEGKNWLAKTQLDLSQHARRIVHGTASLESSLVFALQSNNIWFLKAAFSEKNKNDTLGLFSRNWLHYAAEYGCLELVDFYLAQGVNAKAHDYQKQTPLRLAVCAGHLEIVKRLLPYAKLRPVTSQSMQVDETLFHLAIKGNHYEIFKLLLVHLPLSQLNIKDREGQTALQLAMDAGFLTHVPPIAREYQDKDFECILKKVPLKLLNAEEKKLVKKVYSKCKPIENIESFVATACVRIPLKMNSDSKGR